KRMLFRQVELNPNTVDSVLSELLSKLSDKNQILIYVSPEDFKHLDGKLEKNFREALRGAKKVELKADSNVEKGSCIIETGLGIYDARWKTQMSQVESVIDEIFQQSSKA
ncbi:MAG: flagellar assembly protein FliH, partial [Synergistaceae bacterium]|nr:flagellar assembly protein FliH [Synergistaceae bacterium]